MLPPSATAVAAADEEEGEAESQEPSYGNGEERHGGERNGLRGDARRR